MNVLYIGFDIEGVGGIATYSRYQIRALRDLGHRVFIVSLNKQDVQIEGGYADRHIPFVNKYRAAINLVRVLRERRGRFDLVVLNHVFLAMFGWVARLAAGTPYVVNVYNIDILMRLSLLREFAFGRADLVIADCQYTIDRLATYHDRVPPVGLLYDPVDVGFFRPIPQREARHEVQRRFGLKDLDKHFIATTVAFMGDPPNKGHRQMIDALARLNDPRFLYLVVGDGPMRLTIEDHARQAGVASQVKFLGLVDQSALPFLYSGADVTVLVSRGGPGLGEAVPLGLIEASACGVPFICGNQDGSVEAISRTRPNGFAIDPGDADQLAACLRQLADNSGQRAELGANGKNFVDEVFAYDKFVERQGELLLRHLNVAAGKPTAVKPAAATVPVAQPSADRSL